MEILDILHLNVHTMKTKTMMKVHKERNGIGRKHQTSKEETLRIRVSSPRMNIHLNATSVRILR